jgi:hypothetical protein
MDLFQNPFKILDASTRDDRRRIAELEEERGLLVEADDCINARLVITNPRKRIAAEISWLPGLAPQNIDSIFSILESSPSSIIEQPNLPPVARTNLLVAAITRLPEYKKDIVSTWILEITKSFEEIKAEILLKTINEERLVAGFQEVKDLLLIEDEIKERRAYFKGAIKTALDNLYPKELVETVTEVVNLTTNYGHSYCPDIVSDLIDIYEVEAQLFFGKEEENIRTLVDQIKITADKKNSDTLLSKMIDQLVQIVKNWNFIAQPIQIYTKAKGTRHDKSIKIAELVRGLAISLYNDHNKLEEAQQLSEILQDVFEKVDEVVELVNDDIDFLEDIREEREELTYQAEIGAQTFYISPSWIEWKEQRWETDSITRVRWGGVRGLINGNTAEAAYVVMFGDNDKKEIIILLDENVYQRIVDILWKIVGVRLMVDLLKNLRDGESYQFNSVIISDLGIEIERLSFIPSNENNFYKWDELMIWNDAEAFCIGKKNNKRRYVSLSYLEEDNIHVFENAVRLFWKRGGYRLSCLLDPK